MIKQNTHYTIHSQKKNTMNKTEHVLHHIIHKTRKGLPLQLTNTICWHSDTACYAKTGKTITEEEYYLTINKRITLPKIKERIQNLINQNKIKEKNKIYTSITEPNKNALTEQEKQIITQITKEIQIEENNKHTNKNPIQTKNQQKIDQKTIRYSRLNRT